MNDKKYSQNVEEYKQKIKQLEEKISELSQYREDIETIFNPLNALIFLIDKDGYYLKISPTCPEHLLILPREEMIGKNIQELFPPGQANFFLNYIQEAIENEKSTSIEYMLPIQGRNVWFESRVIPILEVEGKPTKVLSVIRDITLWRSKRQ